MFDYYIRNSKDNNRDVDADGPDADLNINCRLDMIIDGLTNRMHRKIRLQHNNWPRVDLPGIQASISVQLNFSNRFDNHSSIFWLHSPLLSILSRLLPWTTLTLSGGLSFPSHKHSLKYSLLFCKPSILREIAPILHLSNDSLIISFLTPIISNLFLVFFVLQLFDKNLFIKH